MSNIQVPKSVKKVAKNVYKYVERNYPNVTMSFDVQDSILVQWGHTCNHELFEQDLERYIGDIYNYLYLSKESW